MRCKACNEVPAKRRGTDYYCDECLEIISETVKEDTEDFINDLIDTRNMPPVWTR